MKDEFRKSKLLLGTTKNFVELQKWTDGAWRLIDETQGNKVLMKQDIFKLMFHYQYRLLGKKSKRIVFDRGKAECILRKGWTIVDDRLNEYRYDSHVNQFISSAGWTYNNLPESRRYIINIFHGRKKIVDNTIPFVKEVFKEETSKEENKEVLQDTQKEQTNVRQSESKSKSAWSWKGYFAMGATVAAVLGAIALSVCQLWNNNKSYR
jgi:hypothetical protein